MDTRTGCGGVSDLISIRGGQKWMSLTGDKDFWAREGVGQSFSSTLKTQETTILGLKWIIICCRPAPALIFPLGPRPSMRRLQLLNVLRTASDDAKGERKRRLSGQRRARIVLHSPENGGRFWDGDFSSDCRANIHLEWIEVTCYRRIRHSNRHQLTIPQFMKTKLNSLNGSFS
ncbi:MAG: hypothetical protein RJA19_164 [Bacteroidota bacterium]